MVLLIEIGNSRIKWQQRDTQSDTQANRSGACDYPALPSLLKEWSTDAVRTTFTQAWVASVGCSNITQTVVYALEQQGVHVYRVCAQQTQCGVHNAYAQPETLGVDRWLGLIAARQEQETSHTPYVIVSAGTALTVDVLELHGRHTGGLITPGLSLMRSSLNQNTELLPLVSNTTIQYGQLGTDTHNAIVLGTHSALIATIAMVYESCARNTRVVISGGNSEEVYQHLPTHIKANARVDSNWLFTALAIVAGLPIN